MTQRIDLSLVVLTLAALALLAMTAWTFLADFDRIFPPCPLQSSEARAASGALAAREAVDNPRKSAPFAVSNFLDIDHDSYRQASTRRP